MELPLQQWLYYAVIPLTILLVYFLRATTSPPPPTHAPPPPGPRPLPIIGSLHELGDKPHLSFARLAAAYGPVMSIKLGRINTIVISSPEAARQVLQKKDQAFCSRSVPDASRALGHHEASIAWLPVSAPWKNLRLLCSTELFVAKKLDLSQSLRRRKMHELTDYVRRHCAEGRPVDVGRATFMTTLNMISNTLFSVDAVDATSDAAQEFRDLMWGVMEEAGNPNVSDFFPCLRALDLQGKRRRMAAHFKKMHEYFDRLIIDRRLRASETSKAFDGGASDDFLDKLLQCRQLDPHALKSLLTDVFIGGSDTSSNTTEWAMAELLRNPVAMATARAELAGAIGSGTEFDESTIIRLPYLRAVVNETLRLHSPVPFLLPRRAEESVELCGYAVPKGSQVLINVWAIGRDGGVWPEPEKFMPERFLGEDGVEFSGRNFELIPFGAGRRICPGLPLANRMVHLMLASLLCSFDWKLVDGLSPNDIDMTEKFGLTLAKAVPLLAIPVTAYS